GTNANAALWINYRGYADGNTQFRDLYVGNGKGGSTAFFQGSTGNVGIGSTAPGYKLDVTGTAQFSQPVIVGTPTAAGHATTKSYVDSMFTGSGQWTTSGTNIYSSLAGNVGIGSSSPGVKLDVVGTTRISSNEADLWLTSTGGGAGTWRILGSTGSTTKLFRIYDNEAGADRLDITSGGNIGIGTAGPSSKLHVVGDVRINSDDAALILNSSGATTNTHITFSSAGSTTWEFGKRDATNAIYFWNGSSDVFTIQTTGNVGIGTTGPKGTGLTVTTPTLGDSPLRLLSTTSYAAGKGNPIVSLDFNAYNYWSQGAANSIVARIQAQAGHNTWADRGQLAFFTGYTDFSPNNALYQRMVIDFDGNVGIGSATPGYKLDVVGTGQFSQPVIVGTPTATGHATTKSYVDSAVSGGSGPVTRSGSNTYLTNTGDNFGIGTTSPEQKLHVVGANDGIIAVDPSGAYDPLIAFRVPGAIVWNLGIDNSDSDKLKISRGGGWNNIGGSQDYVTIDANGNVGIGTTGPATKLQVAGTIGLGGATDGSQRIEWFPDAYHSLYYNASGVGTGAAADVLTYYQDFVIRNQDTTNVMTVKQSGNVGIGSTSPGYKLDVAGTGAFSQPVVVGTPTAASHATTKSYVDSMFTGSGQWTTSGTNIYSSLAGNVGIGTTAPAARLHVYGTAVSDARISIQNGGTGGRLWDIYSTNSSFSQGAGKLLFYRNWVDGSGGTMVLDESGNVGIGTTGPEAKLQVGVGTAAGAGDVEFWAGNRALTSGTSNLLIYTTDSAAADKGGSIRLGGANSTNNYGFATIAGRAEGTGYAGYLQFGTSDGTSTMNERMR
ncbi:MAG: hypothetical protein HY978_03325, partial [Candidatus Liptonbacteria bacterium]|nr:hypothetical protein [Candidatus Liptonbacteria bacterium]